MSLLTIIFVFVVVGFALWAINTFVPMDSRVRTALSAVVVFVLIVWVLLGVFGGSFPDIRIGG